MKRIRWNTKRTILFLSLFLPLSLLTFIALSFSAFFTSHGEVDLSTVTTSQLFNSVAKKEKHLQIGQNVWFSENVSSSFDGRTLSSQIDPTTFFDLLPHLKSKNVHDLNARVLLRAQQLIRSPPELLLVIPSMYRKEHNYLADTLRNLFANMLENERHLVQIVVVLSENPWDINSEELLKATVSEIQRNFGTEIRQGFIEVISPPNEWFPPNFDQIRPTFGDSLDRMRWRAKQSLDYAYAMFHTRKERPAVRFYVQLEDDVVTVPGFLSELLRFANAHPNFFVCEFSNLGFIGRMFHNGEDLVHLAYSILLFYRSLPVDWILTKMITTKFCSLDESLAQCMKKRVINVVLFRRNPPLFQHVGLHSSLPGKMQNLTETRFSSNKAIQPLRNQNPPLDGVRSEKVSIEKWRDFYEKNMPVQLEGTDLENEEDNDGKILVQFVYGQSPLMELRGLRLFYSVQFSTNLSSVHLPNSLLRVRFEYSVSSSNAIFANSSVASSPLSSFSLPNSAPLYDYFLLIAEPCLTNVRSIRIYFSGGDWIKAIDHFAFTSIRIVT